MPIQQVARSTEDPSEIEHGTITEEWSIGDAQGSQMKSVLWRARVAWQPMRCGPRHDQGYNARANEGHPPTERVSSHGHNRHPNNGCTCQGTDRPADCPPAGRSAEVGAGNTERQSRHGCFGKGAGYGGEQQYRKRRREADIEQTRGRCHQPQQDQIAMTTVIGKWPGDEREWNTEDCHRGYQLTQQGNPDAEIVSHCQQERGRSGEGQGGDKRSQAQCQQYAIVGGSAGPVSGNEISGSATESMAAPVSMQGAFPGARILPGSPLRSRRSARDCQS